MKCLKKKETAKRIHPPRLTASCDVKVRLGQTISITTAKLPLLLTLTGQNLLDTDTSFHVHTLVSRRQTPPTDWKGNSKANPAQREQEEEEEEGISRLIIDYIIRENVTKSKWPPLGM